MSLGTLPRPRRATPSSSARPSRARVLRAVIDELVRARAHIAGKRYEQKAVSIDKCVEIINGLSSSLDFEQGGETVANLARIYEFCATHLHGAGIKMDPGMVDKVVRILSTIRQGWKGVQERNG